MVFSTALIFIFATRHIPKKNTMKNVLRYTVWLLLCLPGCKKASNPVGRTTPSGESAFTTYMIRKGQQFCEQRTIKRVDVPEMKFVVKFDSTAVYQTASPENQYDINKLYGFSDNDADHHQFSARFGWRWSGNALRLFAYVYNAGAVLSKELAIVDIGKETSCAIQVASGSYIFSVNGVSQSMPRMAKTPNGKGFQLYPYFGGDEVAPHDITILLK
jgi:hypothetical protein